MYLKLQILLSRTGLISPLTPLLPHSGPSHWCYSTNKCFYCDSPLW